MYSSICQIITDLPCQWTVIITYYNSSIHTISITRYTSTIFHIWDGNGLSLESSDPLHVIRSYITNILQVYISTDTGCIMVSNTINLINTRLAPIRLYLESEILQRT